MKKNNKYLRRLKIKRRIAGKITGTTERPRLAIYKSNQRIYAQIINDETGKTIVSVSSVSIKEGSAKSINVTKAKKTGALIAEKAKQHKIEKVVFDRSGYTYHGKVKALAEGARNNGIKF